MQKEKQWQWLFYTYRKQHICRDENYYTSISPATIIARISNDTIRNSNDDIAYFCSSKQQSHVAFNRIAKWQ